MNRSTHWLLTPVLVLLSLAACGDSGDAQTSGQAEASTAMTDEQGRINLGLLGFNEGDEETAPIRIIEFSDFGCAFCAQFHIETYPSLYEEFVSTGKVAWKYIPFTLGNFPNSDRAALASECAIEQGSFPAMRDILYENQGEWLRSSDPEPIFERYAVEAGAAAGPFNACMADGSRMARVEMGGAAAAQLGVRGTPTFFIDGYPVAGAVPLDVFREALTEMLAGNSTGGG